MLKQIFQFKSFLQWKFPFPIKTIIMVVFVEILETKTLIENLAPREAGMEKNQNISNTTYISLTTYLTINYMTNDMYIFTVTEMWIAGFCRSKNMEL